MCVAWLIYRSISERSLFAKRLGGIPRMESRAKFSGAESRRQKWETLRRNGRGVLNILLSKILRYIYMYKLRDTQFSRIYYGKVFFFFAWLASALDRISCCPCRSWKGRIVDIGRITKHKRCDLFITADQSRKLVIIQLLDWPVGQSGSILQRKQLLRFLSASKKIHWNHPF